MRCSTLLTILAAVLLYLLMGALMFGWLEASEEEKAYDKLHKSRHKFLEKHNCVQESNLSEFTQHVIDAIQAGVDARSTSNFTGRWNPVNAAFFCGTIITTIGFGNLSPKTKGGQLFCIFYALVGIPMFGILLAGVGDHLGTMLRRAVAKIEALFPQKKVSHTSVRIISAVFSILIGCLIFIALPIVVFQEVENWTLLEAGYFVVITLTTVGFGDFVAGENQRAGIYKALVLLWIVFGLAYFASILNMIAKWLRMVSKKTRAEMEELRAHATDWTQNIQNMSMDFRLPVPLDLNDPFQLQRRRRRKRHRRARHRHPRAAMDRFPHGVSLEANSIMENGHLSVNWPGSRYNSASDTRLYTSYERRPGSCLTSGKSSRPVSHSELRSDSKNGSGSFSGLDSLSETPSDSWSQSDWNSHESMSGAETEKKHSRENDIPVVLIESCVSLPLPPGPSSPSGPSLLDFFGENLAYIDESSDTLSDRIKVSGAGSNRPRRPMKKSTRRRLPSMGHIGLQRACSSEICPPSCPPVPPPLQD